MYILFYDYLQSSNAPAELISPSLADVSTETSFSITIDRQREFDCVGIGYTDATTVTVNGVTIQVDDPGDFPTSYSNGLYLIDKQATDKVTISHNGTYIGRIAIGLKRLLGCSPSREPGLWSTEEQRTTLSGQTVPGSGGVAGRKMGVTVTYKYDYDTYKDIQLAYPGQLSKGYPVFIAFTQEEYSRDYTKDLVLGATGVDLYLGATGVDLILGNATNYKEVGRFPWGKLYAYINGIDDFILQSSVNRFLYSRNHTLEERY